MCFPSKQDGVADGAAAGIVDVTNGDGSAPTTAAVIVNGTTDSTDGDESAPTGIDRESRVGGEIAGTGTRAVTTRATGTDTAYCTAADIVDGTSDGVAIGTVPLRVSGYGIFQCHIDCTARLQVDLFSEVGMSQMM